MAETINKVIFGSDVLIDLTSDTVEASSLLKGKTAHDKSGAVIEGACTFDSDTTDANATASEILSGRTAYVQKNKITGEMVNNEGVKGEISNLKTPYVIPVGYHDGSGTVDIEEVSKAQLTPKNIREGISILGVLGTMSGTEGVKSEEKTVTPTRSEQVVLPGSSYNYLSKVTVSAIPYALTPNSSGGQTATIAGIAAVAAASVPKKVVR